MFFPIQDLLFMDELFEVPWKKRCGDTKSSHHSFIKDHRKCVRSLDFETSPDDRMSFMGQADAIIPGKLYDPTNEVYVQGRKRAKSKIHEFNNLHPDQEELRDNLIRDLFGSCSGNFLIEQPFYCDYGSNIHIGNNMYSNHNLTILDVVDVRIGDNVFFGPNVGLYTAGHPLDLERRIGGLEFGLPITIEDNVWIGGSVTVLPGITIGKNSVIAAGSVVVKDIPAGVVAVGNPCKVLREIDERDKRRTNFRK
ncbi:LAMI_0C11298g1_1 [Lachancea mirantina]|uniref:Acetyltransferase n=1 Tax=Lachancea mirantina TaxID=1230905 RepID=A0A1G4J6I7_9SACH|nr:LAMI_0C11298g1_1 [Lachancea mirantina]